MAKPIYSDTFRTQQGVLLTQLAEQVQPFRTPSGKLYARIEHDVRPLERAKFWIINHRAELDRRSNIRPEGFKPEDISRIMLLLEARAMEGPAQEVHVRVAAHEGALYLDLGTDLGTDTREVVQLTPLGWTITGECPVNFVRPGGLLPLPRPERGGSLDQLRDFVNVATEDDFRLVVAWLLGALHPSGPYPILALHGEQGSAKSTTTRLLRSLVDPNKAPIREAPRNTRDLAIAAEHSRVLALDNLSGLSQTLSDALCRLATGSGFATRKNYSDDDECIFAASRPILLNGIEDVSNRGDVLDRAIVLTLPAIPDRRRKTEAELNADFAEAAPFILGALLDAACDALRASPAVRLEENVRMADFAAWVCAAEQGDALPWRRGDFLRAYRTSREQTQNIQVEASPLASAIVDLLASRASWTGTMLDLDSALRSRVSYDVLRGREWPNGVRQMGAALLRVVPALRALGITVDNHRTKVARTVTIARAGILPDSLTTGHAASGTGTRQLEEDHGTYDDEPFDDIGDVDSDPGDVGDVTRQTRNSWALATR